MYDTRTKSNKKTCYNELDAIKTLLISMTAVRLGCKCNADTRKTTHRVLDEAGDC